MMKIRAVLVLLVSVVVWCVVGVGGAVGAPGDLDTSFSTDGIVTTAIGTGDDWGYGVTVDSEGRIVVAGWSDNGTTNDFTVVRYTSAGVLDTSFDTDGKLTTDFGGYDSGSGVAVDSDDRIVVAGQSTNGGNTDFAVVRYTSAGVLDTSFSGDGKLTTDFGSDDDPGLAVAVDSEGRIVVAGTAHNGSDVDFAVVRYTSAGVLDTSFGTAGKVTTAIGPGNDIGRAVAVDSAGRVVVAGTSHNGSDQDFAVVRYTSAGVLDTSFSNDGKLTTDITDGGYDSGFAVAVDSQDRVVVAGTSDNGTNNDFAVVRYTADGVLDTSFGDGGGMVLTEFGGNDQGNAIAVDSLDRIIVAGNAWNGSDSDFAVAWYTSAGVLDTGFGGGDGKLTTDFGTGDNYGFAVAVDSAGRVVVAGTSHNGTDQDFAVARYTSASVPGAPTSVQGVVVGGVVVVVTWVAPVSDGGSAITDYVVEYSSDGGATWSVFADGVSTSTVAVVLSNGTRYVFRVSAVNAAGTGAVSVVSAVVVPIPAGCTIVGTPGDDVLVGTSGADHICGLGGNDTIYGKSGNDVLDGGPGNDVLKGGKGRDKLFGGTGRDVLFGRGGADVLKGGPGNDKLYGNGGRDRLYGKAGNDRLAGGSNRDKLYGNGGRDKLYGGKARDLLVGGAQKDTLDGGSHKDTARKPGPDVLVSIEIIVP